MPLYNINGSIHSEQNEFYKSVFYSQVTQHQSIRGCVGNGCCYSYCFPQGVVHSTIKYHTSEIVHK